MVAPFHYETERLILRDWREEDWAPFWEGLNTPAVTKWIGGVADAQSMANSQERLVQYAKDWGHTFWCVERREDGQVLGFCGLKRCTDKEGPFGMMEAGWRLREDAWGQGYAKEGAMAALDLSFDRFGADETMAMTLQSNAPSWGLMRRLGMTRRPELDFKDTVWPQYDEPIIIHAITREHWAAHRASLTC